MVSRLMTALLHAMTICHLNTSIAAPAPPGQEYHFPANA